MGGSIGTIIVEPRFLVREALASLMGDLSYRVICSVGTAASLSPSTIGDERKLVVLGAISADGAASETALIRKLWPDSKIMLLLESVSSSDLEKLLAAQIDGCVPLYVSTDTLSSTLQLIINQDLRVMVVEGANVRPLRSVQMQEEHDPKGEAPPEGETPKSLSYAIEKVASSLPLRPGVISTIANNGAPVTNVPLMPRKPTLSERETQILDGLVKGHANKVIARACDISEATVKVHMKSILRKIRVSNRTQAAIWALEHGYCADGSRDGAGSPAVLDGTAVI